MSVKPVWLLDIDGVINVATRRPQTHAWPEPDWFGTRAGGLRVVAVKPVIDFIKHVHTEGFAEIRWHTTWQRDALELGEVLGLPAFSVAEAPELTAPTTRTEWWKLPAVTRVLYDERRALVWTDDDIASELSGAQRGALARGGRALLLSPDAMIGLSRSHLRKIERFLWARVEGESEERSEDAGEIE